MDDRTRRRDEAPVVSGSGAQGEVRALSLGGALAVGVVAWAWCEPGLRSSAIASGAATVAAVAFAAAAALWPERPGTATRSESLLSGAGVSLLCGALIWLFGHRQFGGFDHSALIDLGWRMASGQRPGVDFASTLPIGFVLGVRHAIQLFGSRWSAFVAWQACFAAVTCWWSFALLRRQGEPAARAALLAVAVQASANLVTSYWWYNSATTTLGALFFLSTTALWRQPASRLAGVSYIASLVLLAGMKPNVAGVLILGVTLALASSAPHRRRAIICSGAAFVLFSAWLAMERVWLPDVLRSYLSISGRGFSLAQFLQDLTVAEKRVALLLLAVSLAPWVMALRPRYRWARSQWLAVTAALAGTYGFLVNGENKFVDLPMLLLALWWLGANAGPSGEPGAAGARRWRGYVAALAAVLAIGGMSVGALRQRVRAIGPGRFFEYALSPERPSTPFFARMEVGQRFIDVERQVGELLAARPQSRVFFGPRMQWAYAAFRRPSPVGQPVWWHRGVSYPDRADAEDAAVAAWETSRPELLVFLRDDFTYLPPRMRSIVRANYEAVEGFPALSVFVRRRMPDGS
jgi:hypothetical protein